MAQYDEWKEPESYTVVNTSSLSHLSCSSCQKAWKENESVECDHRDALAFIRDGHISRARRTLPRTHFSITEKQTGVSSVSCHTPLEANVVLGPLEAPDAPLDSYIPSDPSHWLIFNPSGPPTVKVCGDEERCNWLSLIRPAAPGDSANLMAFQYQDGIYFISTRPVEISEELCYHHGPAYTALLNIFHKGNFRGDQPISLNHQNPSQDSAVLIETAGCDREESDSTVDDNNAVPTENSVAEIRESTKQARGENISDSEDTNKSPSKVLQSPKNKTANVESGAMEFPQVADNSRKIPLQSENLMQSAGNWVNMSAALSQSDAQTQTDIDQSEKPTQTDANQSESPTQTSEREVSSYATRSLRKRSRRIVKDCASPPKKARDSATQKLKVVIKKEKEETPVKRKRGRPRKEVVIDVDDAPATESSLQPSDVQTDHTEKHLAGGDHSYHNGVEEKQEERLEAKKNEEERDEVRTESQQTQNEDRLERVTKKSQKGNKESSERLEAVTDTTDNDPSKQSSLCAVQTMQWHNLEALDCEHEHEILQEVAKVLPPEQETNRIAKRTKRKCKQEKDQEHIEDVFDEKYKTESEDETGTESERQRLQERRLFRAIEEQVEKTLRLTLLYCTDEQPQTAVDMDTVLKLTTRIWLIRREKLSQVDGEVCLDVKGKALNMKPYLEPCQELDRLYNSPDVTLAVSHPEQWGDFINLQVLCQALDSTDLSTAICNICGWKNLRPNEVKFHLIRTHTAIQDYLCDLCGMKFNDWRQLWRHKYSHVPEENKKRYCCDKCDKVFNQKSKLTRHLHIHKGTNMKQICEQCGKAFRCKDHLKRHVACVHMNHRNHNCPLCGRAYKEKRDLKRHVLVVHNIAEEGIEKLPDGSYQLVDSHVNNQMFRIFECVFCSQPCRDRTEMRRHLKKVHPENKVSDEEILASIRFSTTPLPPPLLAHQIPAQYTSNAEEEEDSPTKRSKQLLSYTNNDEPSACPSTDVSLVKTCPQIEVSPLDRQQIVPSPLTVLSSYPPPPDPLVSATQSTVMVSQVPSLQQQPLTFTASAQPMPQVSMATAEQTLTTLGATGTVLQPADTAALHGAGSNSTVPLMQYQTIQVLPEGTIAIPYEYPLDVQQIPTVTYSLHL